MTTLSNLERQHQDIYNLLNETKELINSKDLAENGLAIAKNISILAGKLKIHLSNEDKYLYPALIKKGDQSLQRKTQSYIDEMGDLSSAYMDFKDKYNTRSKILADEKMFIKESETVFASVLNRMHKEDSDLYVVAKDYIQK